MSGAKTNEPGLSEIFIINGLDFPVPSQYQPTAALAQSAMASMALTNIIQAAYRGDGTPDRPDTFSFVLPHDIDDTDAALADFIEALRATPGPHFFADWKQRVVHYTVRANQAFLYLPREDGFGKWGMGSAAEFTLNGVVIPTVVYKNSVVAGDAVPANTVWISKAMIRHPDSRVWVAPFKLGSPPVGTVELLIRYYMVFRVDVLDVRTNFQPRVAGREDKVTYLIEVN